jgi:hypothetical protein
MYLQDQYRFGPPFDFQLQTTQRQDSIFHLCIMCLSTLPHTTVDALMVCEMMFLL